MSYINGVHVSTIIARYCRAYKVSSHGKSPHEIVREAEGLIIPKNQACEHMQRVIGDLKPPKLPKSPTKSALKRDRIMREALEESMYAHRQLGFPSYAIYLKSELWASIRQRVFERDGNSCVLCQRHASCAHHRSYDIETMSGRDISMIMSLCGHCHGRIECDEHGLKRTRREVEELLAHVMENGWRGVAKSGQSQAIKFNEPDTHLEKILEDASKRGFVTLSSAKVINLVNEIRFHRSQAK